MAFNNGVFYFFKVFITSSDIHTIIPPKNLLLSLDRPLNTRVSPPLVCAHYLFDYLPKRQKGEKRRGIEGDWGVCGWWRDPMVLWWRGRRRSEVRSNDPTFTTFIIIILNSISFISSSSLPPSSPPLIQDLLVLVSCVISIFSFSILRFGCT